MSNYVNRAVKFIHDILPYIMRDELTPRKVEMNVRDYNLDKHRHVIVNHGIGRIALLTSDYVIKFDYSKSVWGDCQAELAMYNIAVQEHYEYLFAEITPYECEGHTWYIMPRINGIGRYEDDAWEYISEEENDWICSHGLTDLHNLNYGWKDDHIVIIDYACHT